MLVVYDKVAMKPRFTYLKKEVTEMQTSSATSRVFFCLLLWLQKKCMLWCSQKQQKSHNHDVSLLELLTVLMEYIIGFVKCVF